MMSLPLWFSELSDLDQKDNGMADSALSFQQFDGAALGTRIKLLREMRDMTLQQVGDASGLTKSHVWELEKGRSVNPTVNAVWGLSAALCVSPAMLLGLDDKMPPIDPVAIKIAGLVDREIKRAVAAALTPPQPKEES